MTTTHDVFNQSTPLVGHDTSEDPALREALTREGAAWALEELSEIGQLAGSAEAQEWARQAEQVPPVLHTHDRFGHRIDEVEYTPAYHRLMETAVTHGMNGAPWGQDREGAHVARAAKVMLWWSVDPGHLCPISMTYSVVPALRHNAELAAQFEPLLTSTTYDFGLRDPATKQGVIAGMSMTEKQGGSDVRANTTSATPQSDGTYSLVGHKWFTSAPMSDMFLTLAQAPGGLSCFLVPRVLPGGERNPVQFLRLKDKLGNKSNASSEIEYHGASGWLVGEEGRGVPTIIEMVNQTRLDCVISSVSGMRTTLTMAAHHTRKRSAFGRPLIEQPAMRNVLADLAVESEAGTTAMMRLAGANDRAIRGDSDEKAMLRLAVAVMKYYVCKRAPVAAGEALECFGGNGYIEDFGMARYFRELPLLSIWEGSGNVLALDVVRAMAREPRSVEAFLYELEGAAGADARYDRALEQLRGELGNTDDLELRARRIAELMALLFQGAQLVKYAPPAVADAFCATRLGRDWGTHLGTLPPGLDLAPLIERSTVEV